MTGPTREELTESFEQTLRDYFERYIYLLGDDREGESFPGTLIARAAFEHLMAERAEMRHALQLADSSLTWCQARHGQHASRDEVLDEAVRAVTKITRRR